MSIHEDRDDSRKHHLHSTARQRGIYITRYTELYAMLWIHYIDFMF